VKWCFPPANSTSRNPQARTPLALNEECDPCSGIRRKGVSSGFASGRGLQSVQSSAMGCCKQHVSVPRFRTCPQSVELNLARFSWRCDLLFDYAQHSLHATRCTEYDRRSFCCQKRSKADHQGCESCRVEGLQLEIRAIIGSPIVPRCGRII